jgi:hypothetical protein
MGSSSRMRKAMGSPPMLVKALWLALIVSGCRSSKARPIRLEGDEVVVARVDSMPITKYELDQTLVSMLGESGRRVSEQDQVRKTVLDGMIHTRALASAAEKELTAEEAVVVDRQTAAYREQLLAKRYLMKHAPPEPVTSNMVEEYYLAHPERFGAKTIRSYEFIATEALVSGGKRDEILAKLKDPDKQKDWRGWTESLRRQGLPLVFHAGEVADAAKIMNAKLLELMKGLKTGQASPIAFVEGRAYLARITNEEHTPPRPLDEVRDDILGMLGPTQVSEAVKRASSEVLKNRKVTYP